MIIGVNARFLTKPYTGIGQHTRYLFNELAEKNPNDEFILVTPGKPEGAEHFEMYKNLEIVVLPEKMIGTAGMKKTYWEQVQVPKYLLKRGATVIHFPYPSNPWWKFPKPVVVTVHDTIPWTMDSYRKSFLTRLYQDRCKNAVKKADYILTVSESTKKDVGEVCDVPMEKISVSYNGISHVFRERVGDEARGKILRKYNIDSSKPYFLYVGGYDERKNVEMLVKAYLSEIAPEYAVNLVLAGGKSLDDRLYESFDNLTKLKNNISLRAKKGNIVTIGFVDENDLPALYQSSFAFLNLSSHEGFNLPLLEALVSGTPVIVSDLPVHHEVAGDSAIYCHPDDQKCLTVHMKNMLDDPAYSQKQKQKAEGFLCPYTWAKTAEKVIAVYKKFL
jgi:glycosyltransferase involved in cell wall biosynthesis